MVISDKVCGALAPPPIIQLRTDYRGVRKVQIAKYLFIYLQLLMLDDCQIKVDSAQ